MPPKSNNKASYKANHKANSKGKPNGTTRKTPRAKPMLLKLYVAGQTPKSVAAFDNLKRICNEHMPGQFKIDVIDLLERPQLARGDQIVAIPTVVKRVPTPLRKLIGDLSDTQRVLVGLDIRKPSDS